MCKEIAPGSPPHVRGKGVPLRAVEGQCGITPTYAGKSLISFITPALRAGSPPHMRGKGKNADRAGRAAGITPAYAGKSSHFCPPVRISWDHPRVCGEKTHDLARLAAGWGSPPHVRGKGAEKVIVVQITGITPAHAGKREQPDRLEPSSWDHPRTCGEKSKTQPDCLYPVGSPPHMRGKVFIPAWRSVSAGITPAHAGKRACMTTATTRAKDHPRTCGEKADAQYQLPIMQGSPPHMRGKEHV